MDRFGRIFWCAADHEYAGCISIVLVHTADFAERLGQVEAMIADRQGGLFADFAHDVDFVVAAVRNVNDVAMAEEVVLRHIAVLQHILQGDGAVDTVVRPFDVLGVGTLGNAACLVDGIQNGHRDIGNRQLTCLVDGAGY